MKKKLTIQDMKVAVDYVNNGNYDGNIMDIADEDFVACDFGRDLGMGNIRVADVAIELDRRNQWLDFPWGVFKETRDNTVGALLDAINAHFDEKAVA